MVDREAMERSGGYRGLREVLFRRRARLERRALFLQRELAPVFRRRRQSASFGKTLTIFSVASFVAAGISGLLGMPEGSMSAFAVPPLVLAFPAAFVVSRGLSFLRRRELVPLPKLPALEGSDDQSMFDLDMAEAELDAYARKHERGLEWSLIGLGWTLPLTIHYGVALCGNGTRAFGVWIALSTLMSLQSHITLAFQSRRFARLLADDAKMNVHFEWFRALALTTLVASIPWALLAAIPTIITAITGLLFVPAMYILAKRRATREHALVNATIALAHAEEEDDVRAPLAVSSAPVRIELSGANSALPPARAEEEDADRGSENDRAAGHKTA